MCETKVHLEVQLHLNVPVLVKNGKNGGMMPCRESYRLRNMHVNDDDDEPLVLVQRESENLEFFIRLVLALVCS